jgi:hypothetical protein
MRPAFWLFLLLATLQGYISAHEIRPAYLQLHQTDAESYDIFWKVPAVGDDLRISLYVRLPRNCSNVTEPRGSFVNNAYTEQWKVRCAGGLAGESIRILGLTATLTDALVRQLAIELSDCVGDCRVLELVSSNVCLTSDFSAD